MRPDGQGTITLRSASFNITAIRQISTGSTVLAAVDRATSIVEKEHRAAELLLARALAEYRP